MTASGGAEPPPRDSCSCEGTARAPRPSLQVRTWEKTPSGNQHPPCRHLDRGLAAPGMVRSRSAVSPYLGRSVPVATAPGLASVRSAAEPLAGASPAAPSPSPTAPPGSAGPAWFLGCSDSNGHLCVYSTQQLRYVAQDSDSERQIIKHFFLLNHSEQNEESKHFFYTGSKLGTGSSGCSGSRVAAQPNLSPH